MFKGTRYRLSGFKNSTLVIDDVDVHRNGIGIATISHTSFSPDRREGMARRILAAMTLTQNLSLAELEAAAASPFPDHEVLAGPLTDTQRGQARELLGNAARDEVMRAIALMGYLNGMRDAPPRQGEQIGWLCKHSWSHANPADAFIHGSARAHQSAPKCKTCGEPTVAVWISTGT
jgi:hypothetical protein